MSLSYPSHKLRSEKLTNDIQAPDPNCFKYMLFVLKPKSDTRFRSTKLSWLGSGAISSETDAAHLVVPVLVQGDALHEGPLPVHVVQRVGVPRLGSTGGRGGRRGLTEDGEWGGDASRSDDEAEDFVPSAGNEHERKACEKQLGPWKTAQGLKRRERERERGDDSRRSDDRRSCCHSSGMGDDIELTL